MFASAGEAPQQAKMSRVSWRQWVSTYWPAGLLVLALLLALAGQWLVSGRERAALGVVCFAVAAVCFVVPIWRGPVLQHGPYPRRLAARPGRALVAARVLRFFLAANALALAVLAYQGFAGNRLMGGLWPWLAALLCFGLAFAQWPGSSPAGARRRVDWTMVAALAAITLLAIGFRVYRLDLVPVDMTSDHAEKLLDVQDVLDGARPIFFERNTGREMFQFYLTAALIWLTPLTVSHLALKVGTALFGILTVPMTYFLARDQYGRLVGLLAAFFLAVSHWHVAITRVGLRFPFTAAFAVPALYFLLRALRHNRRNDWLAAGLVLGVGLHTYTAMRVVPLLFLLLVGVKVLADGWRVWRRPAGVAPEQSAFSVAFWVNGALGGLAASLVFLPLLRYMRDAPESFWYRAQSRSLGGAELGLAQAWSVFWGNVRAALLMFNYKGDVVPINTVPESPVLGLVSGGLFVLGGVYLLWRLLRLRQRRDVYLVVMVGALLLPSILSLAFPQENPSVVRTGGAVPLVMIWVALPLAAVLQRLWQLGTRPGRGLALLVAAGLLLLAVANNYRWYFVTYDAETQEALWNTGEMGAVVRAFLADGGSMADVYHVPFPYWADTRNIAIEAGHPRWNQVVTEPGEMRLNAEDPAAKLYLIYYNDEVSQKLLSTIYPAGTWQRYDSARAGKDFWVLYVPARTVP